MAYKNEMEAMVLGVLKDGPLHGYKIAQTIRQHAEGVLKLGDNQIYPTLHRLELSGLVAAEWEQQEGKPNRKVYRLTEKGTAALKLRQKEWERYITTLSAVIGTKAAPNV